MNTLLQFRVQETGDAARQIATHLRELVLRGRLPPDMRLPPTPVLAAAWHASVDAVQRAMARLVDEGLISRTPRKGTFVRPRGPVRTRVAVYYPEDAMLPASYGYIPALHGHIRAALQHAGSDADIWMDARPAEQQAETWPALAQAVAAHRLQGLILPYTDWPHMVWTSRLGVPAAYCTSARLPNAVAHDARAFFALALQALSRPRCRAIGLISLMNPDEATPDGSRHEWGQAVDDCRKACRRTGVAWRRAWIQHPAAGRFAHLARTDAVAAQMRFGYDAFHAIWRHATRPDGLIVDNDVAAAGVIAAMLERGVRGGRDVRLVLQRNRGVNLFCPMPALFVDYDTAALAEALVAQLQRQWRGEPVEKVFLKPTLREC
ncbi:MAG: GntR family transcriptional regulator [Lentisphaerae bacterium]|nr:GntR family transcriptional regulator [Lentisphaerota bacterium]